MLQKVIYVLVLLLLLYRTKAQKLHCSLCSCQEDHNSFSNISILILFFVIFLMYPTCEPCKFELGTALIVLFVM